ncbi:MAG: alpha/beta hydrolase [Candidatus Saccharibacteria bacterium]|nr:alpha/beta hydrolase [Candidatus Saccharibacteria bacterium]
MKLRHKLTQTYLTRATRKFTLSDLQQARKWFDTASNNKVKLKVRTVKDLTTTNGIRLRYYRNNATNNKLPVVLYFHGGGFALGSIESHDSVCRYLAKFTDCIVLSVEYSLAPEATYPVPIEQGLAVVKWLQSSDEIEDAERSSIFLAGDSAGGNIALAMAVNPKLDCKLKGLVLIYPALDPRLATQSMEQYSTGHFLTKQMLVKFWSLYLTNGHKYALPTKSELKLLPPVLVIAAEKDVLKDEGLEFVEQMYAAGKEVEYECYDEMLHGFVQFPRVASRKVKAFRRIAKFVHSNRE